MQYLPGGVSGRLQNMLTISMLQKAASVNRCVLAVGKVDSGALPVEIRGNNHRMAACRQAEEFIYKGWCKARVFDIAIIERAWHR